MDIEPRCRHHATCGGCGWQNILYPEQLAQKQKRLEELLATALGPKAPQVLPVIGMPVGADGMPWGFRQKASFVFGSDARGRLVMGHYARGTHDIVPVTECPVHSERANRIAFTLRDGLVQSGLRAWDGERNGVLRHVVVRTTADEKEAVAAVVVAREDKKLIRPLRRLLDSRDRPDGLVLNLHDRPGPFLVGRESARVDGPGHVLESALGTRFLVSSTSFFQTNVKAAGELLRLVKQAVVNRGPLRILDLYSGSGLFSLPLALGGHQVTSVEESRKASRDAALNARHNKVPETRLKLICARVEDALPRFKDERFDAVILDPPRQGLTHATLKALATLSAPLVVLVSCNPETLAQEAAFLARAGYTARPIQPVDMFPHTAHIEAVAVFEKARAADTAKPSAKLPPSRKHGHRDANPSAARKAPTDRPKRGRVPGSRRVDRRRGR